MNRTEIEKFTPHRDEMLLLDEAFITEEDTATGHYHVRGDEFFLRGHFPGNPVVPGVMLCEMMAQTCAVLLGKDGSVVTPLFTGMKNIVFKRMVKPGETVNFVCQIVRRVAHFYFATGKGTVGDELCVSGDFSFAVIEPA